MVRDGPHFTLETGEVWTLLASMNLDSHQQCTLKQSKRWFLGRMCLRSHCSVLQWVISKWDYANWEESQFSSVTQCYLSLCNPMECSTPAFLVHNQLPELAQTNGLFLHMRNERYKRLMTAAQSPIDRLWMSNLHPVSSVLLLLTFKVIYKDLVNNRCEH